jgi:hypothetical protein
MLMMNCAYRVISNYVYMHVRRRANVHKQISDRHSYRFYRLFHFHNVNSERIGILVIGNRICY